MMTFWKFEEEEEEDPLTAQLERRDPQLSVHMTRLQTVSFQQNTPVDEKNQEEEQKARGLKSYLWKQLCGSTFWMFLPILFFTYDLQTQEKNTKMHLN